MLVFWGEGKPEYPDKNQVFEPVELGLTFF